jgi:hypothetical protein
MIVLITLLTISQIISFYLIFNKIKPVVKTKPEGIVLKPIPAGPTYESVDPEYKLVYDVMKSVKLENWKVEIEEDLSYSSKHWVLKIESPNGILIRSRLRNLNDEMNLASFYITRFQGGSINMKSFDSKITNDVIIFLWDYVIEFHENKNEEDKAYYQRTIDEISSKLKTLRRSEKLNNILES